jgi:NADH dehydrogenase [ubiquinone] 1 alpha subcomplex assembly factor 7|eukprot:6867-Pelagococcus_subviridis.AAC.1
MALSQVFGELVGVWCASTWEALGKPSKFSLVELGPGRGTLMSDLLRATSKFKAFTAAMDVHMVEVSPKLREMQREKLRCSGGGGGGGGGDGPAATRVKDLLDGVRVASNPLAAKKDASDGGDDAGDESKETPAAGEAGAAAATSELNGRPVRWHDTFDAVPEGPIIVIAHEFFDAMPVHQFTRTERGWCEKLVALKAAPAKRAKKEGEEGDEETEAAAAADDGALELVLSPGLTPAGALMIPRRLDGLPAERKESIRQLEISPRSVAIWERVAGRLRVHPGAALAVDYGSEGPTGNTLQAIKDHKFVDLLADPGTADLSAYVDFGAMRKVIEDGPSFARDGVRCYGPTTQRDLLGSLQIGARLERLVKECGSEEEADRLIEGCTRLMAGDEGEGEGGSADPGLGIRYKALAMVSKGVGAPVGFVE